MDRERKMWNGRRDKLLRRQNKTDEIKEVSEEEEEDEDED